MNDNRWTDIQVGLLKAYYGQAGVTIDSLIKIIGRDETSIRNKACRMRLVRKKRSING